METLILSSEPLVNTGDFNVHVDDAIDPDARILLDPSDSLGLCQHVTQSTHELGHTIRFHHSRLAYHVPYHICSQIILLC